MTFAELIPGQLARIPRVHARLGELAPVVRIESRMCACTDGLCRDLVCITRDIETGVEHPYHRPPDFAVTVVTPTVKETL